MRMRMALSMLLLVLLLFPVGTGLIVSRCFELSMDRERASALSEETAIARAIVMEMDEGSAEALYAVAGSAQQRYGSQALRVLLLRSGRAMAGAELPQHPQMDTLLRTASRATLLDGDAKTLYIAHALSDELTLLLAMDVSPVYALRRTLTLWACVLCGAAMLLAAALALAFSGMLMRPMRALSRAAAALRAGQYDAPLPPAGQDEIGDLTRAFAAMSDAIAGREASLIEQAARRQELIDALAHEMRSPLTAIVGGSRLLQHARLPQQRQDEILSTMAREAKRLSDMDERLLLLTRLHHEEMNRSRFSSVEMAREALSIFEGVELQGEDHVFFAERELTILLLRNLVVNAQRAGGNRPVCVSLVEDGFSVTDHGCGMTTEQAERAFEPFYKADKARSRVCGGAGLGLTLCRRIAQLHGGTLEILSEMGVGTKVVYHFDTTP